MQLKHAQTLQTKHLTLRAIADSDQGNMLSILTNAEVAKTFLLPTYETQESALPTFQRLQALSCDVTHFVYGIYFQEKLIGFLNDVERTQEYVELGFVIHPDYHNRGFATESLQIAIEALLNSGVRQVRTGAFETNLASIRVMEKCGMTPIEYEETIEYRGQHHRCKFFAIEKDK